MTPIIGSSRSLSVAPLWKQILCSLQEHVFLPFLRFRKMAASAHCGVLPPPKGVTANCDDPETQRANNIALHTIMLIAAAASLGIRLHTRFFILRRIGLDDCEYSMAADFGIWEHELTGLLDLAVIGFVGSSLIIRASKRGF
jgi:hypothetical protein